MSALTPEQLDDLAAKVGAADEALITAFYDALAAGGHFRQGPSGTRGNCSQCGSRWPCHPADMALKLRRTLNKTLAAFGVDVDLVAVGESHAGRSVTQQ